MNDGVSYRGQPLLILMALLGAWALLRTEFWQPPFAHAMEPPAAAKAPLAVGNRAPAAPALRPGKLAPKPHIFVRNSPAPRWDFAWAFAPLAAEPLPAAPQTPLQPAQAQPPVTLAASGVSPPSEKAAPSREAAPFPPVALIRRVLSSRRWSVDAWLLMRKDTTTAVTSGRGSYGQSQAGAILRYRLAPDSPFRPAAYLRTSQALGGAKEAEEALGLSARPIPAVPVSLAAEMRVAAAGGRARLRPAAYAVSELAPFHLPLGFTGEAYAQGGYVWGDYRTAFVDGQVRAERPVARLGKFELRAGGGAWGGAQKGAARVDVGPGATVAFDTAHVPVRVSVDWRFRVAGKANPDGGPTLTVASGF